MIWKNFLQSTGSVMLTLICAVLWTVTAPEAATISNVRVGTFDDHTRLVLVSDAPIAPRLFTLDQPDRLVIDLPDIQWNLRSDFGVVNSRLVKAYRVGLFRPDVSRLVLNLAASARIQRIDQRPSKTPGRFEYEVTLLEAEPRSRISKTAWYRRPAPQESRTAQRRLPSARLVQPTERRQFATSGFDPARADFAALDRIVRRPRDVAPVQSPVDPIPSPVAPVQRQARSIQAPRVIPGIVGPPAQAHRHSSTDALVARKPRGAPRPQAPREQSTPSLPQVAAAPKILLDPPHRTRAAKPTLEKPSAEKPNAHKPNAPKPDAAINEPLIIAIDAGHGGRDPGTGAHNHSITEKSVNLAFARTLQALLKDDPAFDVIMTRSTDKFVKLEDRVRISKEAGAHLLISIHADWFSDPNIKGATAYTLSEAASLRNAEEIVSELGDEETVAGIKRDGAREDVVRVLLDLARRETQTKSTSFAQLVVEEFSLVTPVVRGVRRHDLHVLRTADLPAVLIELGFMSNEEDRERLRSEAWRAKTAKAVHAALSRWRHEKNVTEIASR